MTESTSPTGGIVSIAPASSPSGPGLRWLSIGGSFGLDGYGALVLAVYRLSLLPQLTLTLRVILRPSGHSDTVILAS